MKDDEDFADYGAKIALPIVVVIFITSMSALVYGFLNIPVAK